ncbi:hypothetical protein HDK77DRAFT_12419 [Phyllosticta capitalensis]
MPACAHACMLKVLVLYMQLPCYTYVPFGACSLGLRPLLPLRIVGVRALGGCGMFMYVGPCVGNGRSSSSLIGAPFCRSLGSLMRIRWFAIYWSTCFQALQRSLLAGCGLEFDVAACLRTLRGNCPLNLTWLRFCRSLSRISAYFTLHRVLLPRLCNWISLIGDEDRQNLVTTSVSTYGENVFRLRARHCKKKENESNRLSPVHAQSAQSSSAKIDFPAVNLIESGWL